MKTLFIVFIFLADYANAQERIISYHADIQLNADRSVEVAETITVNAEGANIQRGIFRDIPTISIDKDGDHFYHDIDVTEVLKNGAPEPYSVQHIEYGTRIRIGHPDIYLKSGVYTYTIRYRMEDIARLFDDHDELYWNITGNQWQFEMDSVSARITFPSEADINKVNTYSGVEGATTCDCHFQLKDNVVTVWMDTTLGAYEGLTVAVALGKGVITAPTKIDYFKRFINNYKGVIAGLAGLILVFFYYMAAWSKVGKDPKKGVIIPRFEPPSGFSPAAARYVMKMKFDNKAFTASIVNMAVKGYLVIHGEGKDYVLRKTGKGNSVLTKGEEKIAEKLFGQSDDIVLRSANHGAISSAIDSLDYQLHKDFQEMNFRRNMEWLVPGIALSIGTLIIMFYVTSRQPLGFEQVKLPIFLIILSLIVINIIFYFLIKAPTVFGRKRMDELEGLKMYMEVAEKDRLNMLNPPEENLQLFESLLPYAIALNVENAWAKRFEKTLAQAIQTEHYQPTWYVGAYGLHNWGSFSHNISSSLTSSISAASISPQSSSSSGSFGGGFSGGGFSGGGSGGGGGGGW